MAKKDTNENGPAVSKRSKISKTQQQTMFIVLIASIIVGVSAVLGIYFFKTIKFNSKVIEAKDEAISDYEKTIKNVGLCRDTDRDGKYSDEELSKCDPDSIDSSTMSGTLRYNIMVDMAKNVDLESVARESDSACFSDDGKKIDFQKLYDDAETDSERSRYISMLKACSALRVIPDALPAQANEEALMASLNQIFILSGWEPEALSPSGNAVSNAEGVSTIPISLKVEANSGTTVTVLNNIERSIRTFEISSARITWSGTDSLTLQAQGSAFYTEDADVVETNKTIYASSAARKKGSSSK